MQEFDFGLGETLDMLRASVRQFADREIAPIAAAIDRGNEFPRALWPKLGELGVLGITVGEQYGGVALGYATGQGMAFPGGFVRSRSSATIIRNGLPAAPRLPFSEPPRKGHGSHGGTADSGLLGCRIPRHCA